MESDCSKGVGLQSRLGHILLHVQLSHSAGLATLRLCRGDPLEWHTFPLSLSANTQNQLYSADAGEGRAASLASAGRQHPAFAHSSDTEYPAGTKSAKHRNQPTTIQLPNTHRSSMSLAQWSRNVEGSRRPAHTISSFLAAHAGPRMCLCCSNVTCTASTNRACVSLICACVGSSHCVTAAPRTAWLSGPHVYADCCIPMCRHTYRALRHATLC